MMANTGMGGYYQIWFPNHNMTPLMCYGNDKYFIRDAKVTSSPSFRVFWDGDLYDEITYKTSITSWNENRARFDEIFGVTGCEVANGTKATPALQADLFGDWREELCYPTIDGTALRVFTTDIYTDYKIKTLMSDNVYRSGVAAQQTAYNQPPHIGFYIDEAMFRNGITSISIDAAKSKLEYRYGEMLDETNFKIKAQYGDGTENDLSAYSVSGYDSEKIGVQEITISAGDVYTTVNIMVYGVDSIQISKMPSRTNYNLDDVIYLTGIELEITFDDGTSRIVSEGFTIVNPEINEPETKTIILSYGGKTCEFDITVKNQYSNVIFDNTTGTFTWPFNGYDSGTVSEENTVYFADLIVHLQPSDFINKSDGIYFAGNGIRGNRCIEYTPQYNGTLTVLAKGAVAAGKYTYVVIYNATTDKIEASKIINGRNSDEIGADVISGHTYYIYGYGNGTNNYAHYINKIMYTAPELVGDASPKLKVTPENEDNLYTFDVSPENCSSGVIIAALKKQDRLVGISTAPYYDDSVKLEILCDDCDEAVIMLWNGIDEMKPIAESVTLDLNEPQ